jgi:hypothetical protein
MLHCMSNGGRWAAITGIWLAVAAVIVLNAVSPWFRQAIVNLDWVTGMITGWILCTLVRARRH